MRVLIMMSALLGMAYAADSTTTTTTTTTAPAGTMSMQGMSMQGGSMQGMNMQGGNMKMGSGMAPDAQHCAEMEADQKAGKLPDSMKLMLAGCQAKQQPAPAATQDR